MLKIIFKGALFILSKKKVSGLIVMSITFYIIILIMWSNIKSSLKYSDQQVQHGMNLYYIL